MIVRSRQILEELKFIPSTRYQTTGEFAFTIPNFEVKKAEKCKDRCEFASYKLSYRCVNCHYNIELVPIHVDLPTELLISIFLMAEISILEISKDIKDEATNPLIDKILSTDNIPLSVDNGYKLFVNEWLPSNEILFKKILNCDYVIQTSSCQVLMVFSLKSGVNSHSPNHSYYERRITNGNTSSLDNRKHCPTAYEKKKFLENTFSRLKRVYNIEVPETKIKETIKLDFENKMREPEDVDDASKRRKRMFKAAYLLTMAINDNQIITSPFKADTDREAERIIDNIIELFEPIFREKY